MPKIRTVAEKAAVGGVLGLRQALTKLTDRVVPADIALFEQSLAMARTMLIQALVELEIPERLAAGPKTAEQLARDLRATPDALHRTLRAAAAFDFVKLDKTGRFHSTRLTKALTNEGTRAWCRYITDRHNLAAWADLPETIRTGKNAIHRVYGMSVWEYFDQHPEIGRTFATAMRTLTEREAPSIVAAAPLPETGIVCDVAGGTGAMLASVLEAKPGLRGVLVEGALAIDEGRSYLSERGVIDRVELVEGDIFGTIDAKADVYLLKNVLHDWDDTTSATILNTVAASMPSGAQLLTIEATIDPNEVDPFTTLSDMHMMLVCEDGRERSIGEFHALFRGAGLTPGAVTHTATGTAVLEATKP
jgi:hypothetical protein